MRRTLKLLLLIGVGLAMAKPKGPDGSDGPPNRSGDGDGPDTPPQRSPSGKIDTGQGTESASKAVQAEAEKGRSRPSEPSGEPSKPTGPDGSSKPSDSVTFSDKQLNKKFKHAEDFGIEGNNNRANQQKFKEALIEHVDAPGTQRIEGTYRGQDVIHYVDPATGRNVMTDRDGNLLSAWTLNEAQLQNVTTRGSL
ncbi:MAG TPA: colicin D domain-containing protein [Glycomyces sp.]|nr:colicin D domain-containing protein [Glycomyces sp.]